MLTLVMNQLKTKKYVLQMLFMFGILLMVYFILDYLNTPYAQMHVTYGIYLVIVNITLNIVMAFLSSLMMAMSMAMVETRQGKGMGSNLGFFSILFGILTYGCTSCVITFFASLGIAFSVAVLPLAGLGYKFISLGLIFIGLIWIIWEIKKGYCKIK